MNTVSSTRRLLSGHGRPPFVLVVEDEPDQRDELCELLFDAGYVVFAAADGRAALDLLQAGLPVDLVTLDIHMPGLDGQAFLQAVAEHTRFDKLPIVVVSAYARLARFPRAVAQIGKPIDTGRLLAALERHAN